MTLAEFELRANLQNGCDREFDDWKIIDIHEIPDTLSMAHEVDFYCSNGERVYLLRLRNRRQTAFSIVEDKNNRDLPIYLVAELPIGKIDNELLSAVLKQFEI